MYKTIRHGENSLQYTILPQNDDFRIEGKLSSNGSRSSSGSAASGGGAKRGANRKRRSFFAYLGLIFVCTVIIGALLIPFLVSAECLPSPTEWFLKTKAAFTHSASKHAIDAITTTAAPLQSTTAPVAPQLLGQSVGQNVQITNRNGVEQFILKLNKTAADSSVASTTTTTTTTSTTTTEKPTTSTTTRTTTTVAATEPAVTERPATIAAPAVSNRPAGTITTRIIQVPLLKSAAKKPIMPPVLAKTQSNSGSNSEELAQNKSNNAWRWAYIDPSTYVQWSGYKAEDSVLLPALLGFALIGMILIITVCLVARNKRTIVSSVRKRNRNDIEEQGEEDNATLLTTTNLSDDD